MAKRKDPKPERDSVADEVDRLLKKLPFADPASDPDAPASKPAQQTPAAGPRSVGAAAGGTRVVQAPGTPPAASSGERLAVWAKLSVGLVLGVGLTQWPYANPCGLPLFLYLAAVGALLLAGGWGGISSWQRRLPVAHIVSLVVVFWGIVLAAEQILPRVGYARAEAAWLCDGTEGRWFPGEPVVAPPPTPAPAPTTDPAQSQAPAEEPAAPPAPASPDVP